MTNTRHPGYRRATIFAVAATTTLWAIYVTIQLLLLPASTPLRSLVIIFLVTTALVAGLTYAACRGILWIIAGFRRPPSFPQPGKN